MKSRDNRRLMSKWWGRVS